MIVETSMSKSLAGVPLFEGLSELEREQIYDVAVKVEYRPGDVILRQGKQSQNLWVVLSGSCEVYREPNGDGGKPIVLAEIGENSHFGEMSFFRSAGHSASVRAKSNVTLLRLRRGDFDELIRHDSLAAYKLAYNTIAPLAEHLRRMDERIAANVQPAAPQDHVTEWSSFRGKLFDGWNL
jgi:CRP-like cAMP-binding protein